MDAFPKIFSFGTRYVENIFDDEVEVTEKVDGSQIGFCNSSKYGLVTRSKGRIFEVPDKMFEAGAEVIRSLYDNGQLPKDYAFYGEYLRVPDHNTLAYGRIPTNHIALFGVQDPNGNFLEHYKIRDWADKLGLDCVSLIYFGKLSTLEQIKDLMSQESFLGKARIEGVVVKNYHKPYLYSGSGKVFNIMCAKYVSEAFKEVHRESWGPKHSNVDKWSAYKEGFKTEARWRKAIEHLRDDGKLLNEPKDIGPLIKELYRDIEEECKEEIKEFLWNLHKDEVMRKAVYGFPEFYKQYLVEKTFERKE